MGLVLPVNGSLLARLVDSMAAYYPDREIVLRVEGEALDFWAVAKIETPNG